MAPLASPPQGPVLWPHHWRTVERLRERFGEDARFSALIVGGSLAKEYGREDSDVDVVFIATPEEARRREAAQDFGYFDQADCDYAGGHVDSKVVDLAFLRDGAAGRRGRPSSARFPSSRT
ncbi:nucleotidyltransferase domain-containing protein [Deinococcus hopiensis]|nr:nucleotidyltransferase domain-containing protein [Deinococcus hopiensis]